MKSRMLIPILLAVHLLLLAGCNPQEPTPPATPEFELLIEVNNLAQGCELESGQETRLDMVSSIIPDQYETFEWETSEGKIKDSTVFHTEYAASTIDTPMEVTIWATMTSGGRQYLSNQVICTILATNVHPPLMKIAIGAAIATLGNTAAAIGQEQELGLKIAEDYFEEKKGYQIEIILAQAGETGDLDIFQVAEAAFENLVQTDAIAIIGPTLSSQALLVDEFANEQHVPVIAISNTHPDIPGIGTYIFRISAGVEQFTPHVISKVAAVENANNEVMEALLFYLQESEQDNSFTIPECQKGFKNALGPHGINPASKLIPYTSVDANDPVKLKSMLLQALAESPNTKVVVTTKPDFSSLTTTYSCSSYARYNM